MWIKSSQILRFKSGVVPTTQRHSKRRSLPRVQTTRGLPDDDTGFSMAMDGFSSDSLLGVDATFGQAASENVQGSTVTDSLTQSAPTAAAAAVSAAPIDIAHVVTSLDAGLSNILQMLPEPIQGVLSTVGHDILGLATFDISLAGGVRLALLYYVLFTRPSPISAILDYYVLGPVSRLTGPKFSENDFTLRDRLGNGNYGQGTSSHCLGVCSSVCF